MSAADARGVVPMGRAEETLRHRLREAILAAGRDGATASPLLVEEADNLADAVLTALYPHGHEDTPEHWRANAAHEKRKKQHVSELLRQALRELAEYKAVLACLVAAEEANQDASDDEMRAAFRDDDDDDDACVAAHDRAGDTALALDAAWERARELVTAGPVESAGLEAELRRLRARPAGVVSVLIERQFITTPAFFHLVTLLRSQPVGEPT